MTKIYAVQFDIQWEDKRANFDRVTGLLNGVEPNGLIVLPEMFASGFSMNVGGVCESESRESECFLQSLAQKHRSFVIGGLVTKAPDGRGRNEAAVFDPQGDEIVRYCKMHPFSYAGETDYYQPGDKLALFEWNGLTAAIFICYDLRFPEIFRHAVQCGAELFVVIACWPQSREAHWTALLQARAIENQAYVVGVNRCGADPKLTYSGRSLILDPRGNALADAGNEEAVVSAELDSGALQTYRRDFPVLADIRTEYRCD